ncbi:hypothetical protein niasHS_002165 [Heterodera schachtii]|uniref:Uncharacterized protein n=1 Tax=Heterodera schachtii TaxID=97005 RepID=A0ABD2KMW4_HETSC
MNRLNICYVWFRKLLAIDTKRDIMATACKLEMSLDEIIKANKSKTNQASINGRKTQMTGKRLIRGNIAKRKPFVRKQINGQNQTKKFGLKRVGINVRRGRPLRKSNRVVVMRKNFAAKNRAAISATKNLVNKLVKKALNKSNVSPRGKRFIVNSARRVRTIMLNKVSPRSRVITRQRQRIVAVQPQQQPVFVQRVVRGRGPIRYASDAAIVPQTMKMVPKRRFRINPMQQQQPVVLVQNQSPKRRLPSFSSMSVRQHINALRRATTVQQLQTQFVNQQLPIRQQFRGRQTITTPVVPNRSRGKQQFILDQPVQAGPQFMKFSPRRQRRQPASTQYVIVQQPSRGTRSQFRGKPQQSYRRNPKQQQAVYNPMYEPPNFLQRIPTGSGAPFIQY